MPDSKRFLHPEAIRRIARMEVRARHIVEGFLTGSHRSPYFGQSVEFLQHRQYVVGDDLRHVDWQVWARQDRLYVKQFEEDTNLRCHLLIDISGSMLYGSGPLNKYEYGCTAAASLAYLILKQQDAVGGITFDSQVRERIPVSSRRNHIMSIVKAMDAETPENKSDIAAICQKVAQTFPRRGMMILVSDLLTDTDQLLSGLRLLRQRGHDVLVFHIMDDDELDFEFDGPTRFEDLETDAVLSCNPRGLREGYMQALDSFLEKVRHGCAKNMIDYALIRTSDPLDAVLAHYLSNRLGMHHKN
ncbi:MAG: DUF58 domain-containing protein [Pirellulaceae bacterium]|nr:DUF58 domain-containing protein [Pirellulaceae bacterium]